MLYFALAVIAAGVIWLCTDRTVFKGSAFAVPNSGMRHYSKDSMTVNVTFSQAVCRKWSMIASVRKSRRIAAGPVSVTVRRRLFGAPRVRID
jgi:hypothetical protein